MNFISTLILALILRILYLIYRKRKPSFYTVSLVIISVIVWSVKSYLLDYYIIPTSSMAPTLKAGNIHTLRGEISFTLRHFVNLFRDVIYHHKSLQDNRIPDYFRTAVQLILQLKNNNDDDRLYQWLNSRNICLTTDKIHWC